MDQRPINSRKEKIHKRVFADALVAITVTIAVIITSIVVNTPDTPINKILLFDGPLLFRLLVIAVFLTMASWVFAFRRCMDIKNAVKEFSSVEDIKDEFISNLRHELKTPLVPIKGYSELLFDRTLGETNQKQSEALQKIITSSEKLERRIDSLLFMSAVKYGEMEYLLTPLRIEDLVMGAISEISESARDKEQKIEVNIQSGLSFIEGDRKYLKETIVQILDNATKFSPPGQTIHVVAHEGYKSIHIKVIDKGNGIPENEIDNVFQRFYQIDGSKTRRHSGNGMGLHIAKNIIEVHGGNIWIESTYGSGTTVHIRLPSYTTTNPIK